MLLLGQMAQPALLKTVTTRLAERVQGKKRLGKALESEKRNISHSSDRQYQEPHRCEAHIKAGPLHGYGPQNKGNGNGHLAIVMSNEAPDTLAPQWHNCTIEMCKLRSEWGWNVPTTPKLSLMTLSVTARRIPFFHCKSRTTHSAPHTTIGRQLAWDW